MIQKVTTEDLRQCGLLPSDGQKTGRKHGDDEYPQLGYKVFIVGSCFLAGVVQMLVKAGCKQSMTVEDADLILYTGGEDVDPSLYGEKVRQGTYFSAARDAREMEIFERGLALGKPQFGICRGMQFLHVMNGGKLYQDVSNHGYTHEIVDFEGTIVRASSMHHQMCIEDDNMFPVAWATEAGHSGRYATVSKEVQDPAHMDLEAAIYPNINAFAVQGHPEVGGYPDYTIWCLNQLKDFIEDKAFIIGDNAKKNGIGDVEFLKTKIGE